MSRRRPTKQRSTAGERSVAGLATTSSQSSVTADDVDTSKKQMVTATRGSSDGVGTGSRLGRKRSSTKVPDKEPSSREYESVESEDKNEGDAKDSGDEPQKKRRRKSEHEENGKEKATVKKDVRENEVLDETDTSEQEEAMETDESDRAEYQEQLPENDLIKAIKKPDSEGRIDSRRWMSSYESQNLTSARTRTKHEPAGNKMPEPMSSSANRWTLARADTDDWTSAKPYAQTSQQVTQRKVSSRGDNELQTFGPKHSVNQWTCSPTETRVRQQETERECLGLRTRTLLCACTAIFIVLLLLSLASPAIVVLFPSYIKLLPFSGNLISNFSSSSSDLGRSLPPTRPSRFADRLDVQFPNQTMRLWAIIKAAMLPVFTEDSPIHPAVILLVGPKGTEVVSRCLALQSAKNVTDSFKSTPAVVFDARADSRGDEDSVKKQLDDVLTQAFEGGVKSGIVLHLESLPGPSAMIFYRFCDNDNAPFKRVVIILTLTLEADDPGTERDSVAYNEMRRIWGSTLNSDKLEPLLSRIGNSVAFVRPESPEVLKKLGCIM